MQEQRGSLVKVVLAAGWVSHKCAEPGKLRWRQPGTAAGMSTALGAASAGVRADGMLACVISQRRMC
jgi:hypothetical protein